MYFEKQIQGEFAKPNKDFFDGDIVIIKSEGEKRLAKKFKEDEPDRFQNIFEADINGRKMLIKFNGTSLNNMIEAYGNESKEWIGKEAKVWIKEQLVGNKIHDVAYFAHPKAECVKGEDNRLRFELDEKYVKVKKPKDAK